MSFRRLLVLNLLYHRRGNLAVFLGVTLGAAVLTGALLVGDSLRGSLRELMLDQLGWVDQGLVANRFFRAHLADELAAAHACPALILQGNGVRVGEPKGRPVPKITVLGVDARFWPGDLVPVSSTFWQGDAAETVLNTSLAEALHVQVGDTVAFNVQKAEDIPRETLLGKRRQEDVVEAVEVKVRLIIPDQGMGRFTLRPSPTPVRNAFVPLAFLQRKLALEERANALLASGADTPLDEALRQHLTLADWNLKVRTPADRARSLVKFLDPRNESGKLKPARWQGRVPPELARRADAKKILSEEQIVEFYREKRNYLLLESQQMLLEDAVTEAVSRAFPETSRGVIQIGADQWWQVATLIYLADSIADDKKEVPYAVVAAQGPLPEQKDSPPYGNEIDLAEWADAPLQAKPGDALTLSYYAPDDHNHLQLISPRFQVRKRFSLEGNFDDPDLVPEFPGITDKLDMASWENPPFPYNPRRVKAADEAYWKRYRTTPRAYIGLEKGQELWGSRFGKLTSVRFFPLGKFVDMQQSAAEFSGGLLQQLRPEQGGFVFQNVREQGLKAGGGSVDFEQYFLAFSFFLIVAALLLVGLLFRLNLDLRSTEIGVLLATGWTCRQVRRLLLSEGAVVAVAGTLAGLAGALLYADQLLKYLSDAWPGETRLTFLRLHITGQSLAIGAAASLAVSLLTILWAVRILGRMSPRSLLAGETTASAVTDAGPGKIRWSLWICLVSVLGALACTIAGMTLTGHEAQAGSFFGSGAFLLTAGLTAVWFSLRRSAGRSNPRQSVVGLGMRNAGRHAVRSVLTAGLLGSATFLIVAVESFHKDADREFLQKDGGSGGFSLLAETDIPVFQDLNAAAVRKQLFSKQAAMLDDLQVYACRVHAGDDASCLNLYQPQRPRVLGVPHTLVKRGGFAFGQTLANTKGEKENPWLLLEKSGDAVPAFVDANTAQWILKVKLGDTVPLASERGETVAVKIVGLLRESIFQSELVISEARFRKLFPRQEGFTFFLLDTPTEPAEIVKAAWETALADNGVVVESTANRLRKYLEVENMYLSTFQALGGLGLLLGAVGLAIVLLRGAWERRGELALLRALGFRRRTLGFLVLAENVFLLLAGLATGTIAAIVAVAPHLAGSEAQHLWLRVLGLLSLVVVVGVVAGVAAVSATLRAPLIQALRRE